MLVVLCTWNERENLPRVVDGIRAAVPGCTMLVVDDGSPDGTGQWAEEEAARAPDLHCLVGFGKQGLGASSLVGLRWGLERGHDPIGTLDADLSHDPAFLPELLRALSPETGSQPDSPPGVAIGSRYVPGGRTVGWPVTRRIASWAVNGFARFWLRIPARDCTSGMRLYRASALRQVDLTAVRATGYAYLEELLLALVRAGVRVAEVPIVFRERAAGKSKVSWGELQSSLRHLLQLANRR